MTEHLIPKSKYYSNVEIVDAKFLSNIQNTREMIEVNDIFTYELTPSDEIPDSIYDYYCNFSKKCIDNAMKVIDDNIKYVYAVISYPLANIAIIKFTCRQPVTYGMLLYLYTVAYKLVYKIEDYDVGHPTNHIPGMFNRQRSSGRFGIWGHDIEDLVYNGNSSICVYEGANDSVVCRFECDS